MPSERTLTQEYGLSRDTVRSAIGQLRAEGLVTMRRGRGAVVKEIPPRQVLTPPAGATVTTRMPTLEERAELGLGEGVPIFWVVTSDGSASGYPGDRWELYWA